MHLYAFPCSSTIRRPSLAGVLHLTGTFPRFATVPEKLSPVFRHSSYGYLAGKQGGVWEVAPAVNWTTMSIANQRACGEWARPTQLCQ